MWCRVVGKGMGFNKTWLWTPVLTLLEKLLKASDFLLWLSPKHFNTVYTFSPLTSFSFHQNHSIHSIGIQKKCQSAPEELQSLFPHSLVWAYWVVSCRGAVLGAKGNDLDRDSASRSNKSRSKEKMHWHITVIRQKGVNGGSDTYDLWEFSNEKLFSILRNKKRLFFHYIISMISELVWAPILEHVEK